MFRPSVSSRKALVVAGALLTVAVLVLVGLQRRQPAARELAFTELLTLADQGQVRALTLHPDQIDVVLDDGSPARTVAPAGYVASNPTFMTDMARREVVVRVEGSASEHAYRYVAFAVGLTFFGLIGFTIYRVTAGRIPSIETSGKMAARDQPVITFADVEGVDEAKDEVREIVEFLREPARFAAVGGRIPKGVLLVGPPGTGKTLLARSIAGEAGVPFVFASGSDFVEMYAGVGASRVRRLFKDARRHKSCIIFIDELDAVGRNRGSNSLSHEEREQTLNQLLVEMDGFAPNQGVVVIAATNRQDILDPALLRPGRFDRQVTVGNPDLKGREAILRVHARRVSLLPEADPLHKVTIIPRGRALGVTMQLPEADRYTHSKPFIEAQIAILMGGRVAEELFLRQMTSGASNDIERATELARKMVCELGMSQLGPVHFRRPSSAWDNDARAAGFSEETARRVDDEIRANVMRGYETARQIVEQQRQAVKVLAEELLEIESVDADRLKEILATTVVPVSQLPAAVRAWEPAESH